MANIKLTPEISDILNRSTITGNNLVLPSQLNRADYVNVNKVIMLAGGKWNTKAKAHVFNGDPRVKLGMIIETGVAIDEKKQFQSFFTPPDVARKVVRMANVDNHVVLEPSAGEGALADECLRQGATRVDCVELNPDSVAKLRAKCHPILTNDFLSMIPDESYKRIVMNPPFTKNQDIKHVAHALNFLAPGGILVAIMSPNTTRSGFKKLIDEVQHEIVELPAGSFKESGTQIATIILKIVRP